MPAVTAPWHVRTNAPNPTVGFGTTRGDIFDSLSQWLGADHVFVELTKDVEAPDGSDAVNVRLERPLHLTAAYATAFSLYGYARATVELSIIAREGARAREARQEVVQATSVIINPAAPDIGGMDWEFPDQLQPLLFERPAANPGPVTVGVRVDCFVGVGGFFACTAGCRLATFVDGMTVEWLWP